MPRLVAIEWDASEARVVAGMSSGSTVSVEQAFIVPFSMRVDAPPLTPAEIGARLGAALAERGLSKLDALVAVGRSSIELRLLTVPPAPKDELPDLVRFQAIKQLTTLGDDWPVDFVPLEASEEKEQTVLAATVSPELIEQLRQTCAAAGLNMRRLMLRPFAAAATVVQDVVAARCGMLVDLLAEEADLTVTADGKAVFPRTVRLPATDEETVVGRSLAGEIRRTMVAAANQLAGRRVEEIVLLGRPDDHAGVRAKLSEDLDLPVRVFDPFDTVQCTGEVAAHPPHAAGRFAPLVGMLREEAAAERQGIDFLHPRRRPDPPDYRRRYVLAGATAAAVLLAIFLLIRMQLGALDEKISDLTSELAKLEKNSKTNERIKAQTSEIDKFVAGDHTWLEELRTLSTEFLPPEKVLVTDFQAFSHMNGDGRMVVSAIADSSATISDLETKLRDERHNVSGSGAQYNPKLGKLPWRFAETIQVTPEEREIPDMPAPEADASDEEQAESETPAARETGGRP
jgi:Tfp pilus assembly PilM family ATPase/Tfp pilus assembly protein PilN